MYILLLDFPCIKIILISVKWNVKIETISISFFIQNKKNIFNYIFLELWWIILINLTLLFSTSSQRQLKFFMSRGYKSPNLHKKITFNQILICTLVLDKTQSYSCGAGNDENLIKQSPEIMQDVAVLPNLAFEWLFLSYKLRRGSIVVLEKETITVITLLFLNGWIGSVHLLNAENFNGRLIAR